MFRKLVTVGVTLLFAFSILSVSVLRAASIKYAFYGEAKDENLSSPTIDYSLPYPGRVLPNSPLWPLKALRDRLWLLVTLNRARQAELLLLFADKRLVSSQMLMQKGKPELAVSTFTKAEKYLERATTIMDDCFKTGIDTKNLAAKLATAALKHREVAEGLLAMAPEDAKPGIIKTIDYSKSAYILCRESLLSRGLPAPENPFNRE
jgi:hypothetical protein